MATAPEVFAVERLHQAAQARLGIAAAYLTLIEWERVQATEPEDTSALWLIAAIKTITAIRKMSRALAISYLQLVRALETGRTLGVPEGSDSDSTVTLGELRRKFANQAIDIAAIPSTRTRSEDPDIRWFEENLQARNSQLTRLSDAEVDPLIQKLFDVEGSNDSDVIEIEDFSWPEDLTLDEVDAEFSAPLRKRAVQHSGDNVRALRRSDLTPDQIIDLVEETHGKAGSIGAGIVDRAGLMAGREAIIDAILGDDIAVLVARGTSGDPCAFCAMLASRGFVYRGLKKAGVGEGIKQYHEHCHCYPIVRYSRTSELPELNVYFQEKWIDVTAGYSGLEARKAWRRWIYAQRKANPDAPHGAPTNS